MLFGLVAWFALPQGVKSKKHESGWPEALRVISKDRQFQQVLVAAVLVAFIFFQISSTLGLYMTGKGISFAAYGLILSLNGLVVVIFELPLTMFSQRFPVRKVMALGYALVGLGFAANAFAETISAFILTMLVLTLGEMISMPVAAAYIADLAPEHMRGRYMGVNGFTWALALVFGPSLGMLLFRHSGTALWLTCGFCGLAAAAIMLRTDRPQPAASAVEAQPVSGTVATRN